MTIIPVMRPKLPTADKVLPYIQAIDSSQFYSNFGPLICSLEERLAEHFGSGSETITTVANATLGLVLALAAQEPKAGTLCVMPSWTFVASAQAAILAGLTPYFIDVNADTMTIDPEGTAAAIARAPAPVGAVMPVAPFGQPMDVAAWDIFRARTGLAVVIDAAAGFDAIRPSATPSVVSLHATKVLGVGEGGFVMSSDSALIQDVRSRSNFGFAGTREAIKPAGNAKLSEYHAAVGLAGLDEWPSVRNEWLSVAQAYGDALSSLIGLRFQNGFGQSWIASTCVINLVATKAAPTEKILNRAKIETRRWWGAGAHTHHTMNNFPRTTLPATEALANSTIALPFFRDLTDDEIKKVS